MYEGKRALRAKMRAFRTEFAMANGGVILPPAALLDRFTPGVTLASYVPIGSEADPTSIAWAAREAGCAILLPYVAGRDSQISFHVWEADQPLITGPFGLQQPDPACERRDPDIVLTPMLAFDAALNRLGQGAGHYDRAFADLPDALRIGIAWSVQQVDALDTDGWDIPLHAVITEREIFGAFTA